MGRLLPAAALAATIGSALPAAAQQSSAPWLWLPRPVEGGKPIIYDPQFTAKAESDNRSGCAPGLQCRVQLLGVVEKNGGVELRARAFAW